jgi:hypothetical protein
MNKIVTNCDDCPFVNLHIEGSIKGRVWDEKAYRLNCRLQPDIIKSVSTLEWEKMFANCPLKQVSITVSIAAPNVQECDATDAKSETEILLQK